MTLLVRNLAAAAIIVLTAAAVHAVPLELSVNGGFETGDFSGWVQFPTAGGQQTIVSPGASGTYAACIENQVPASGSVIKNANIGIGLVMPGATVTISFDARGAGAAGGVAFAEFFSELSGGGVSSAVILGGAPLILNADPNVWTTFNFTTPAGPDVSGGVTLQFGAITGADNASSMLLCVDNISVTVDGVVAVEEVTWSAVKNTFK